MQIKSNNKTLSELCTTKHLTYSTITNYLLTSEVFQYSMCKKMKGALSFLSNYYVYSMNLKRKNGREV